LPWRPRWRGLWRLFVVVLLDDDWPVLALPDHARRQILLFVVRLFLDYDGAMDAAANYAGLQGRSWSRFGLLFLDCLRLRGWC
jgi:hypothetical protein